MCFKKERRERSKTERRGKEYLRRKKEKEKRDGALSRD
jgi:hypothetical protein